jgi:hypothetical protein
MSAALWWQSLQRVVMMLVHTIAKYGIQAVFALKEQNQNFSQCRQLRVVCCKLMQNTSLDVAMVSFQQTSTMHMNYRIVLHSFDTQVESCNRM